MDPNLFHLDWDRLVEVLATIVVLAFLLERALALVFEHRSVGTWFDQKGLKGPPAHILRPSVRRIVIVAAILTTPSMACTAGYAGDFDPIPLLDHFAHSGTAAVDYKARAFLSALSEARLAEQRMKGSIEFGFQGDEADSEALYKVAAAIDISRGTYPRELRFRAGVSVQKRNSSLREDISQFLTNYDYHFSPWFEVYGFAERVTDNFLSIQQRYEVGVGVKGELEFGLTGKGAKVMGSLKSLTVALTANDSSKRDGKKNRDSQFLPDIPAGPWFDRADQRIRKDERIRSVPPAFSALVACSAARNAIIPSVRKRYAKYALGLAVSAFGELELAVIETQVDSVGGSGALVPLPTGRTPVSFAADPQQRYRITIRPSVILQPSDEVTLKAYVYLKYPLGKPWRVGPERSLDYRTDVFAIASLSLKQDALGQDEVALALEIEQHYDNAPPEIRPEAVGEQAALNHHVRRTVADNLHRAYKLGLRVRL